MPNPENLIPAKKGEVRSSGRPKGSRNRSTLLKKWLKLKITVPNKVEKIDEETGETVLKKTFEQLEDELNISLEDAITLALIQKAQSGDVPAIKEVLDTLHGKIVEKQDLNLSGGLDLNTQKAIDQVYGDDDK